MNFVILLAFASVAATAAGLKNAATTIRSSTTESV